ncbi:MAG: HAD hydrolase-like protein [Cyanobacteria bacterium]|nr:HAD hydrolase-like protein [Cyanobacteriota bacterium]
MAVFLFDFDGTLADSLEVIVAITNDLAPIFGYVPTDLSQLEDLKGLNARQLIRQSEISVFKIPALLRRLRQELQRTSAHIPPFQGIPELLAGLRPDHTLAIATSNQPANVRKFLAAHQLDDYFVEVVGGGTLFGKGRLIRRLIQQQGWQPSQVIYVGDEARDIEAARFAGIRVAAVTWGFNRQDLLATAEPDWLIKGTSNKRFV